MPLMSIFIVIICGALRLVVFCVVGRDDAFETSWERALVVGIVHYGDS